MFVNITLLTICNKNGWWKKVCVVTGHVIHKLHRKSKNLKIWSYISVHENSKQKFNKFILFDKSM